MDRSRPFERSSFPHERDALERIYEAFSVELAEGRVALVCNLELVDSSTKRLLECDLVLLSSGFIAVVELKHWRGRVDVADYGWRLDGLEVPNPHRINNHKAKVLKSLLETELPGVTRWPYIHSIAVITHEAARVEGDVTVPGETKHRNQTFAALTDFISHVRGQLRTGAGELARRDVERLGARLEAIADQPKQFRHQVPFYEIICEVSQDDQCAEYLAYPQNPVDRGIKRLRVYNGLDPSPERQAKQLRNYELMKRLPPHPHVAPSTIVHAAPLLIEECPWSETGTLRNLLGNERALAPERARAILVQVLEALVHIHAHGVIHRDLSPSSVLIVGETAQLINFHRARDPNAALTVFDSEEQQRRSAYRAQELSAGKPEERSDLYAFGILAYELYAGKTPIKSWNKLTQSGGQLPKAALDELAAAPVEVRDLIRDCVTVDPERRPTAAEALARLTGGGTVRQRSYENTLLAPGDRMEPYEIVIHLGTGATAQVYRARNWDLPVVLKIFNFDTPPERVKAERDAHYRARSASIMTPRTFRWSDGRAGLEFEDVNGRSLMSAIQAEERPARERFLFVADRLLEALADIHMDHARPRDEASDEESSLWRPLVHNDINPANVIETDREVYLIDFGVASDPGLGDLCGTPLYIAPDLIEDGILERSPGGDLFGAAVTLYEWATGVHPFLGNLPGATPPSLDALPDWAEDLAAWFTRALAPGASERFASATEMRQMLVAAIGGGAGGLFPTLPEPKDEVLERVVAPSVAPADLPPALGGEGIDRACGARDFVDYLNSLHNVTADNKNALAESQALSRYFGGIHVSLGALTDALEQRLRDGADAVIVLSGHAGDGKSTIALDLFRRLHGLSPTDPLARPLAARESIEIAGRTITIVKDLSEIEPVERLEVFREALAAPGTWLVVANTGPLLTTCREHGETLGIAPAEVEDGLLAVLAAPLRDALEGHHRFERFEKPMWVVNLTRRDNVGLAEQILARMVAPAHWTACSSCPAAVCCPILANVTSVRDVGIPRVGYLYRRLTDYGQRLTARRITAHLAYALTGGLGCRDVLLPRLDPTDWATEHLFADRFFGFAATRPLGAADELQIVRLLQPLEFGAAPAREVDGAFLDPGDAANALELPASLAPLVGHLAARGSAGRDPSRFRQSLRRQAYFFAAGRFDDGFRAQFLRSSNLLRLEGYMQKFPVGKAYKHLLDSCLNAVVEEFTGFRANQYTAAASVYVTLRRHDLRFAQPVQLVLARFPYSDFELERDARAREIALVHKRLGARLVLSLPLLDYMSHRLRGEVGEALEPILRQRIDAFKAELLGRHRAEAASGEDAPIELLQADHRGCLRTCVVEAHAGKLQVTYTHGYGG